MEKIIRINIGRKRIPKKKFSNHLNIKYLTPLTSLTIYNFFNINNHLANENFVLCQ